VNSSEHRVDHPQPKRPTQAKRSPPRPHPLRPTYPTPSPPTTSNPARHRTAESQDIRPAQRGQAESSQGLASGMGGRPCALSPSSLPSSGISRESTYWLGRARRCRVAPILGRLGRICYSNPTGNTTDVRPPPPDRTEQLSK